MMIRRNAVTLTANKLGDFGIVHKAAPVAQMRAEISRRTDVTGLLIHTHIVHMSRRDKVVL